MSEQNSANREGSPNDLLEKEYHKIGIHAVEAAACIKQPAREIKHEDYGDVIEDTGE